MKLTAALPAALLATLLGLLVLAGASRVGTGLSGVLTFESEGPRLARTPGRVKLAAFREDRP